MNYYYLLHLYNLDKLLLFIKTCQGLLQECSE